MEVIDNFYKKSTYCCECIENLEPDDFANIKNLMQALAEVYSAALQLPDIEPDDDHGSDFDIRLEIKSFGEREGYWQVFNPFAETVDAEIVYGSLCDDLSDIYHDLMVGNLQYEKGLIYNAGWVWKLYFSHWGRHLVDVLKALHVLISE